MTPCAKAPACSSAHFEVIHTLTASINLKISQFRKKAFKNLATFHNHDHVALKKELLGHILSRSYVHVVWSYKERSLHQFLATCYFASVVFSC